MKETKEIDWQVYWGDLLERTKLKGKVLEMNQTDEGLGNVMKIEEICHQIFDDYPNWCKRLEEIKQDFLKVMLFGSCGCFLMDKRLRTRGREYRR